MQDEEKPQENTPELPTPKPRERIATLTSKFTSNKYAVIVAILFGIIGSYFIIMSFAETSAPAPEQFEATGKLDVWVADDFKDIKGKEAVTTSKNRSDLKVSPEDSQVHYEYSLAANDGQTYKLEFPNSKSNGKSTNQGPDLLSGSTVKVKGKKAGNTLSLSSASGSDVTTVTAAEVAPETVTQKVAVVLFNFSDDTSQPFTPADAKNAIFTGNTSLKKYYQQNSNGKYDVTGAIDPTGDVFGWVTLSVPKSAGCLYTSWADEADKAIAATGVDMSVYDHVVYSFPSATCPWGGIANLPGKRSFNQGQIYGTSAHEYGHNLGLRHANGYKCTDANGFTTDISTYCSSQEYGDAFDVMGSLGGHLNGFHLEQLGWLDPASVQSVSASGTYTLDAIDGSTTGIKLLKISSGARKTSGSAYYYVEYRAEAGSNAGVVHNGLQIRSALPGLSTTADLVNATPETGYIVPFIDSGLGAGRTFKDATVSITATSTTATTAVVNVTVGRTSSTADNAAPVSSTIPFSVNPFGGSFTANVVMKNTGNTTWNAADYQLRLVSEPGYLWGTPTLYLSSNVAPGGTATFSGTFTPPGNTSFSAPAGFNWRMYKVSSGTWFGAPFIKAVGVGQGDYQIRQPAPSDVQLDSASAGTVTIKWTSQSNNPYIWGYKVLRTSGTTTKLLGLTSTNPATYTDSGLKAGSTYSYSLVTIGGNGLESDPSNVVQVKVPR